MIERVRFTRAAFAAILTAFFAPAAHADETPIERAPQAPAAADPKEARTGLGGTQQGRAGAAGAYGELGLGYDSNITGVLADYGAAAQQSFNLAGIRATGNFSKRHAAFMQGAIGGEYDRPLGGGWSVFAGGEARGRAYVRESDFNITAGEARAGGALEDGSNQLRVTASFAPSWQRGAASGDPRPTNDRRMAGLNLDWRHAVDTSTQLGLAMQLSGVRFPRSSIEDFDQAYLSASWLRSFEGKGAPLIYLTAFVTADHARNSFENGVSGTSTRSKNLGGLRSYVQYSIAPKLQVFNGLGAIYRKDKDAFARSTKVPNGHDWYGEASMGLAWQFRDKCTLRLQLAYARNDSNIAIYDFNRNEISSVIRCDMN